MKEEEINQAIAEACGWRFDPEWAHKWDSRGKWCESPNGDRVFVHGIPNYCNDLNAMHEAEKTLTDVQCLLYPDNMREVITQYEASRRTWHATARQRAEALLWTIGKWRGE